MSDTQTPSSGPFEGGGGRHIAEAEWERLSMFLDGDLPDEDARQLERDLELDPALKAALGDLQQVSVVLRTVERAPVGFADRVLAAVENEPIPANRSFPLGRWLGGFAMAAAAAVVLFLALPQGGGDEREAAAAKIDLQAIVQGVPDEPPQVAPITPPKAEVAASKGAPDAVKRMEAAKPVGPDAAGGTADPLAVEAPVEVAMPARPEPYGVARSLQYQVPQATRKELANLAAKFGGGLQDASGAALTMDSLAADTSGVVYLSVPTDRLSEFDLHMRKMGKKTATPDAEVLQAGGKKPLRVEIVVDDLR